MPPTCVPTPFGFLSGKPARSGVAGSATKADLHLDFEVLPVPYPSWAEVGVLHP